MFLNFLEFNSGTFIIHGALLLGMIASGMVKGRFRKHSKTSTVSALSGHEIAGRRH